MKTIKEFTMALLVSVAMLATVATVEAQNLGSGPLSFQSSTNVQGYFNAANSLVYVTNNVAGLTNLIPTSASFVPATLFSVWSNPTSTNGTFVGGTNAGVIPLSGSRYVTIQISGVASAAVTNTVSFASSAYPNPTAAQCETTATRTWTFTAATGAFNVVTNIEDDAIGAFQLSAWTATAGSGNITNPAVAWQTK